VSREVKNPKWLRPWLVPWYLGGVVFSLVALTIPHYGITWDEPSYFYASDLEVQWFIDFGKNLLTGEADRSLQDEAIKTAWRWDPFLVPHPPFSRLLSGLTKTLFSPIVDKFTAYRLAPALFFALLVAVIYLWLTEIFDRTTGLFAVLTLVLMPNLFGFAHFAVTDMPLTTMWFLTAYCFWRGLKSWRWSLVLGVVWGFALATKFPAFALPIPLLVWAHLYHRRSYHNNVFSMAFLSPIVMLSIQPYLWHKTLPRLAVFIHDYVGRGYPEGYNYKIFFSNEIHSTSTLPWYYPFYMTAITIPETILFLSLIGIGAVFWIKPQREIMVLFLFNAALILTMGLFPGAVLHDVNRLMLPVLPFLAGLASCGFFVSARYLTQRSLTSATLQGVRHLRAKVIGALSLLILLPPAIDLYFYHPYELSYFNRLVGGIQGAYRRGLEVTYFMEAFDPDFLKLLNLNLPPQAVINASFSNGMFAYYQTEGRLRGDIRITDGTDFDYYILLNRQSAFSETMRAISKQAQPYASVRLKEVPLVSVYKK